LNILCPTLQIVPYKKIHVFVIKVQNFDNTLYFMFLVLQNKDAFYKIVMLSLFRIIPISILKIKLNVCN